MSDEKEKEKDPAQQEQKEDPKKVDVKQSDESDLEEEKVPENYRKYAARLKTQLEKAKEELSSTKSELETKRALEEEAKAEQLKQKGEFEKLYNNEKAEKESLVKRVVMAELKAHATKEGIIDPDVVSLVDISKITVSKDFEVSGVEAAVKAFKSAKPNLFGESNAEKLLKEKEKTKDTGSKVQDPDPSKEKPAAATFLKNPESADAKKFLDSWQS